MNDSKSRVVKSGSRRFHSTPRDDIVGRTVKSEITVEGQACVFSSEFGCTGVERAGDELGNRMTEKIYPDGESFESAVDAVGAVHLTVSRLHDEGAAEPGCSDVLSGATKLNPFGQAEWVDAGNGIRTHYIHDSVRRLVGVVTERKSDSAALQSRGYDYDALGRINSVNDYCSWQSGTAVCCDMRMHSCLPQEMSLRYSYDVAGWLASETQSGITQTYAVNAIGNDLTERFYVGEFLYKRRDFQNGQETVTCFLLVLRVENSTWRKLYGNAESESQPSTTDVSARKGQLRFGAERKKDGLFPPKYALGGIEKEVVSGLYDFGAQGGSWRATSSLLISGLREALL